MTARRDELAVLLADLRAYAAHAGDWSSGDPGEDAQTLLCDLGHLRGLLARVTTVAAVHARDAGMGWDDIGAWLGLPLPAPSERDPGLEREGWQR